MSGALSLCLYALSRPNLIALQQRSLSKRAARALGYASCDSSPQITQLGRPYFEQQPDCAAKTLQELATIAHWPPKRATAVDAAAAALMLPIADPKEAREAATDALIALRRSGSLVAVSESPIALGR